LVNKELIEFKKHSNGHRHTCKKCQYVMEMTNPTAHINRVSRQQKYRWSEKGKQTEKTYSQSIEGKQSRIRAIKKYESTLAGYIVRRTTTAKRRAARIQRTPSWLTDFDRLKIKCMYAIATMLTRENKEKWTIDHIIPLQGELVSGLHVPSNLQPMRLSENSAKLNKFEVIV